MTVGLGFTCILQYEAKFICSMCGSQSCTDLSFFSSLQPNSHTVIPLNCKIDHHCSFQFTLSSEFPFQEVKLMMAFMSAPPPHFKPSISECTSLNSNPWLPCMSSNRTRPLSSGPLHLLCPLLSIFFLHVVIQLTLSLHISSQCLFQRGLP